MKKKTTLFIISFFCASLMFAQYEIKGNITDSIGRSIVYANAILLQKSDTKLVKGGISDENGNFLLPNIKKGEYLLKINFVGYKEIEKQLIIINQDIDLGVLQLEEEAYELDKVLIKVKKPILEQKIDRLTVNVEGTLVGTSGNVLEILERLPGVEISSDGSSLMLNGKSEVGVLMNNKLTRIPISSLLQILSSTNAKNIKNIDLITNPPAKYDAEFTGGLININQIKNDIDGTNGSFLFGLGYGDGYKQRAGVNWNMKKNKLNFYGNLNFDRNDNPRTYTNSSIQINQGIQTSRRTISDRKPVISGYMAQLGLDYYINENITLGGMLNGNRSRYKQNVVAEGIIAETDKETTSLKSINTEDSKRDLITANVNLELKLDSLNIIDFDFNYLNYYNENPTDYDNTFFDSQRNITSNEFFTASKKTPVDVWVGKTNYSKKINDRLVLNLGGKYTYSSLNNTVIVKNLVNDVLIQDPELSEKSNLLEKIGALYSSLDWKLDEKTNINFGLRHEYSTQDLKLETKGSVLNSDLNELFPSLFISRNLGNQSALQFSYGRRVTRPTYFDLAPFLLFLDPNTFFNGNIELKPSISNGISFNYKYKKYLASFQFTNENNAIARKQPIFLEDTSQQVITSLNLDFLNTYSVNLTLPFKITSWWDMENSFQMAYLEQKLNGKNNTDNYYSIRMTQNFDLPKNTRLQLFASYNSERLSGVTNIDDFQRVNFLMEKKIEKWDSKIQLSYNNIFGNDISFFTTEELNTSSIVYEYEPRVLRITFVHNFGNSKVKKQKRRETGIKEIKKRIN